MVHTETPKVKVPLGGSWLLISAVISRITIVITHTRELITPPINPHEPRSKSLQKKHQGSGCGPLRGHLLAPAVGFVRNIHLP